MRFFYESVVVFIMIVNALPLNQELIHSYSSIVCFYSSFINVAKLYNDNICEEFVFLKKNGLNIETNIDIVSSLENIIISNRFNTMVIEFLDDYHIKKKFFVFKTFSEYTEYIYEQLNNSNPIILTKINSNLLNYGPINLQNSNRKHTLVVNGFNKETKEIYFYDYFIPTFPSKIFYGSTKVDNLKEIANENNEFYVFYFDYFEMKRKFGLYKRDEFISDLKNNIDVYMNNHVTMELIANTIKNLLFKFSAEDICKNSRELVFQMMYCSIIPSRILLRNICIKYDWFTPCNEFNTIISEWYTISLLLIKYSLLQSEEKYNKLSKKIIKLIEKEKEIVDSLRRLC